MAMTAVRTGSFEDMGLSEEQAAERFNKITAASRRASAQLKKYRDELKEVKDETKELNEATGKTNKNVLTQIAEFGAMAAAAQLVSRAINKVSDSMVSLARVSAGLAIRFVEQTERLRNMFETREARKFGIALVQHVQKAFETSTLEAQTLVSKIADLSTSMHFTEKSSLKMSAAIIMLAGDLTSFQDRAEGITGTSERIAKSLIGNRKALKDLAITVNETSQEFKDLKKAFMAGTDKGNNMAVVLKNVKAKNVALFKSIFLATKVSETQAKALATLAMAYRQSQQALTDYSRTYASAANQIRAFSAAVEDMKLQLGKTISTTFKLDRVFGSLTALVRVLTGAWGESSDGVKTASVAMGSIFVVLASLLAAVATGAVAFAAFSAAAMALGMTAGSLGIIIVKVAVVIAVVIAVLVGLVYMLGRGETAAERFASGFEIIVTWLLMAVGFVVNFGENWEKAMLKVGFATMRFGAYASQVFQKVFRWIINLIRVMDKIPSIRDALMAGDTDKAKKIYEDAILTNEDINASTKKKIDIIAAAEALSKASEPFNLDIGGAPPSLKALFGKFGAFKPKTSIETMSPKLSESALEGSVEAAKIISANARNDLVDRNLAANERTAAAAEETAKNTKKKAPVANP